MNIIEEPSLDQLKNVQLEKSRQSIDFTKINRVALAALPLILERLLPGGKRVDGEWVALNPRRSDRHAGSFRINIRTEKWADFAIGVGGGDPVSLVAYLEDVPQPEAARRLARMLNIDPESAQ